MGASLYWIALLTNTALIGFVLPKLLNKMLHHNIEKENRTQLRDLTLTERIELTSISNVTSKLIFCFNKATNPCFFVIFKKSTIIQPPASRGANLKTRKLKFFVLF